VVCPLLFAIICPLLFPGFDGVGQWVNGGEYRPWQTVVSGVTGGLAYPLAGGVG
jgi:hypothetical protein